VRCAGQGAHHTSIQSGMDKFFEIVMGCMTANFSAITDIDESGELRFTIKIDVRNLAEDIYETMQAVKRQEEQHDQ
jgi:hypothetical protein